MDTCDPRQVWTTSHCQDQGAPRLVVQNMSFRDGNSTGQHYEGGGGGAIFDRGGRPRIVNSSFSGNRCDPTGPDLGGGAVRALSQYQGRPVYVVGSRFSANVCSNGAAPVDHGLHPSLARILGVRRMPARLPRLADDA